MTEPIRRSWVIRTNWQTPPLSMNDRLHWRVEAKKKAEIRDLIRWLVRAQRVPRMDAITVELHYVPRDNRVRDPENLVATLKPCIDGLRDYRATRRRHRSGAWIDVPAYTDGVVPDDSPKHVDRRMPVIHPADSGRNLVRMWLTITEGI